MCVCDFDGDVVGILGWGKGKKKKIRFLLLKILENFIIINNFTNLDSCFEEKNCEKHVIKKKLKEKVDHLKKSKQS